MSSRGKPETSFIAPERLYTLQGFVDASGIARARIYHARRVGVNLPTVDVGRRKFVRGADAIAFIEALANLDRTAREKAAREMLKSLDQSGSSDGIIPISFGDLPYHRHR